MAKKAKWERIESEASEDKKAGQPGEIFRLQVPGGWLVAASWGLGLGPLTYVPDAEHKWETT